MARTTTYNGVTYTIKSARGHRFFGRYIEVPVDKLTPGATLDQGTFVRIEETMFAGAINPNTWKVCLLGGLGYIESRGASVRVWIDAN